MEHNVRFATPADDAGLRALLRRAVMPGAVRVAFTREPSYGAGARVAGADEGTVVFEHQGRVAATGRCTIQALHRNGTVRRVGYLGGLRADPGLPVAAGALREGFARLADWATACGVEGFVTSIADDNTRARRVLEHGGRLGLPAYVPMAALVTFLAPIPTRTSWPATAAAPTADELRAFLAGHARDAQLTLPWDGDGWRALAAHGITPRDFAVVRRDGRIVAAAGVWDQRPFRQTVVDGLMGSLGLMRPLVDAVLWCHGRPRLPRAGEILAHGAVLAATVPDPGDWPALWRALQARAALGGLSWLTLVLDRRDPWCACLRRLMRPREYRTTLYDVVWRSRPAWADGWDGRLVRAEAGLL